MHVISRSKIREFAAVHPESAEPLDRWYRIAKRARWARFADVRAHFLQADLVGKLIVFNIGGNKFRLIAQIYFDSQTLLIKYILTHRDYDKGTWKP